MARLDLDGSVVVITGGANGIGLAVARAACQRGATVALLDVDGAAAATRAAGDRVHQRRLLDVNLTGVWHTLWAGAEQVATRQGTSW